MNVSNCLVCLMFPVPGLHKDVHFGRYKTLVALTIAHVFFLVILFRLKLLDIIHKDPSTQFETRCIVYTIVGFIKDPASNCFRSSFLPLY